MLGRPTSDRSRALSEPAEADRALWERARRFLRDRGGITALVIAGVAVSAITVLASVTVYLPPDAAHYIGDADAIIGAGVRPLRHPPLFPALVALSDTVFGDIGSVQAALHVSLGLFIVGLYVLLRQWLPRGPSLMGTAAGAFVPSIAELMGWAGGATLLGIATLAFALAAVERWIRRGGWVDAFLAGAALAATALTHPFASFVAFVCVAPRLILVLYERRKLRIRGGALGLGGMAVAGAIAIVAFVATIPYYAALDVGSSFGLRAPVITGLWGQLGWGFGGDPFLEAPGLTQLLLWGLFLTGLVTLAVTGSRGMRLYALGVGAVIVFVSTAVRANITYVTRSAYLLPFLLGIGTAALVQALLPLVRRMAARTPRPEVLVRSLALGSVALILLTSYAPRVARSGSFHQEIEPGDVHVLQSLQGESGAVAVSWRSFQYGTGVIQSWYLEGLSKRRAYGPAAPWAGGIPEQRDVGLDVQRLFAGVRGIDSGAVQVAAGDLGMQTDPAIWARVDEDFYVPVLFSNMGANTYPSAALTSSSSEVQDGRLSWTFGSADAAEVIRQTATLERNRVVLRYWQVEEGSAGRPWSIWFFPGYGGELLDVSAGPTSVEAEAKLGDDLIPFRISSPSGTPAYFPPDASRGRPEGIRVVSIDNPALTITIEFPATRGGHQAIGFEEPDILAENDLSTVVLWKSTGWRSRFELSDCYRAAREAERIIVYDVVGCSS